MTFTRYAGIRFHFGPFYIGEVWRSSGRHSRRHLRQSYSGTLPGWRCFHDHRTQGAALRCARREEARRAR